ncbi:Mitochondrial substrate carrier family protein L [Paramyrothecium foliicola]|nr:Mitochondrial substrate carrier family protein L [Paramyrothecium foliicola]
MGLDSKKSLPLPAPTETETTTTPTELTTTELSKPGDEKSTYSLPEDGTPVTIRTRGHKANRSQTSLLIEYFEGSKSGAGSSDRKPSVRVRLTPSKKGRGDHIQVTETKGSRKASLTHRIPLDEAISSREIELPGPDDADSMASYASATEESNVSRNPIDIEIDRSHRRRRPASPLIPSNVSYQPGNTSEISAIPADSFLDGSGPSTDVRRASSPSRGESLATAAATGALAGVAADELAHSRTRKDRARLTEKPKEKPERKRRTKSRTSSVSEHIPDDARSSRRRSSRSHPQDSMVSGESSVLSSNLSPSHRSMDAHSMRSGTSKSSINNPKLLETVEDAIRRLILPELSALKREQSKRESRRGSITSTGTSVSREEVSTDRRRSSGQRSDVTRDSQRPRERRNREARHDYDETSLHSISRDSLDAEYPHDGDVGTPKRSNNLVKAAAAGAAGAALAKGLSGGTSDAYQLEERKQRERRRRRTDSARSRSLGRDRYAEEYDDEELEETIPAPPMPLMSDINPSELTRTSILSADSDRPQSASEELTPVRTGGLSTSGYNIQGLGTQHANVSHGDLTALPRGQSEFTEEYETNEYGKKVPLRKGNEYEESRDIDDSADYQETGYDNSYYSTQDVPPPLKYVPYQAGARGLSPIPSVSGYTEGGSEAPLPRNSRSDVYSPDRHRHSRSVHSLDSVPSNMRSADFDDRSLRSPTTDYRNSAYTDGGSDLHSVQGHTVQGVGANPNIIHPSNPALESAVASLVDGSMLEQSVLTSGSGYDYAAPQDSTVSYDGHSKALSSRGPSPEKMSIDSRHDYEEERHSTPGARSQAQSQEFSEFEIDEHGRKIPRSKYRHSPTASEAVITAGAVGAAAAALKRAQEAKQAHVEDAPPADFEPEGVFRNKSFKERTLEGREPRSTPAHSIDRLDYDEQPKMSATAVPDANDAMPEYAYMDDDLRTNPSVVDERLDGQESLEEYDGRATPTQRDIAGYEEVEKSDNGKGLGITEAAGAAALGAAAGMAMARNGHSREPSQDLEEWHRTSDERKRDTLVTNPYEDASPINNPVLNDNILRVRGLEPGFSGAYHASDPSFGQKYDEGYMSNGPNRTPDLDPKGKAVGFMNPANTVAEDPFYENANNHTRHLSGMSQGMASPFYDASTGAGIDRIENKDIVALMQHLMVRDAQRSARDTEIVALLMNAALEMRNSFREMKDFMQDTGDDIIFANAENTDKLQKAINGPRPYPGTATRSIQSGSRPGTIDDLSAKKKNLWRRALEGLSAKGTNDLSRIEDMLMQLLGEVDTLKTQTAPAISISGQNQSFENLQPEGHYEQDKGYEPEGNSTASHASQSGHLSLNQARGPSSRLANERKFSDHRISTVPENEEEYAYENNTTSEHAEPALLSPVTDSMQRADSVPLNTPPHPSISHQQPLSAENTPRTDKGRKHKSSSSSGWLPKISRWSETTASSVGKAFRSKRDTRYDDYQAPSRSASSLASYDENYRHDAYGDDKLHSGFSEPNLPQEQEQEQVNTSGAPPAPFMTPEDPKYKAHRNSLNLQHPQPRPGQTERFRTALEYSAQEYDTPMTPKSADWAGSATSLNRLPANTNRYSNASSAAAREGEYWGSSPTQQQSGPPRPPKEPLDSPTAQTPPKSNRISKLAKGSPNPHHSYESGYGTLTGTHASHYTGSPKLENRNLSGALGIPTRRPSGPRAMTPKSAEEEAAREERRRKRDTFGTTASQESETF